MPRLSNPDAILEAGGFLRSVAPVDFAEIVRTAKQAATAGVGILLSGPTGTGKTLALRCLVPPPPPYPSKTRWIDFGDPVQVGWLGDCDILRGLNSIVLDDVGMEEEQNQYGVWSDPFAQFITDYYRKQDRGQPVPRLFVTSNLNADQMSDRYGDRTMSRLLSVVIPVTMAGTDHRALNMVNK